MAREREEKSKSRLCRATAECECGLGRVWLILSCCFFELWLNFTTVVYLSPRQSQSHPTAHIYLIRQSEFMSALGQVPTFFFASLARGVVQLKCYILSYRTSPSTASSVNSIEETSFRHTQLSFTHELLSRAFLYRHLLLARPAPSAYFHALSRSKLRNCR